MHARTEAGGSILIAESGTWRDRDGKPVRFSGAWRWRFHGDTVRLSHERHGASQPVELVDLVADSRGHWTCHGSHLCGEDRYMAAVRIVGEVVFLRWRVSGPRKELRIRSAYFRPSANTT